MPKVKQMEKFKHPNSRKTKAIVRQLKKHSSREKRKLTGYVKLNLLGEKVKWFQDELEPQWDICTPSQVNSLVLKYLARFEEELKQIQLKHSIGNRKNRQHASREDIINMTIKRECEEFNTCGIEIPNLLDSLQFNLLKQWTGELRYLQNMKLRRFSKKTLEDEQSKMDKGSNIEAKEAMKHTSNEKTESMNIDS